MIISDWHVLNIVNVVFIFRPRIINLFSMFGRTISHRGKVFGATLISSSEEIVLFVARNTHPRRIIPPKATIGCRKVWEVVILDPGALPWLIFGFRIHCRLIVRTI